jgi:hypothetical protein
MAHRIPANPISRVLDLSDGGTCRGPRRRRLTETAECHPGRAASASTGGFRPRISGAGTGARAIASTSTSMFA